MSEDWFEVAYINFNEAILHGRRADQTDVRRVLSEAEKRAVQALASRHEGEMQRLLRGYAGELEVRAVP